LDQKTNRRGTPINVDVNGDGRITRIDYNDGTFVAYTYNNAGNILTVEDSTGLTSLDYYPDHTLQRITSPGGRFLEYTYDAAGRRATMLDQSGYQLNYAYNAEGRLESVTDNSGKTLAAYLYDFEGRPTRRTLGNGVYTTYKYDSAGRLAEVDSFESDGAPVSLYHYQFDANNRRTQMTTLDGTWDYTYDLTGQLTNAVFTSTNQDIPSRNIEYVYDAVGNRIREIVNGVATEYATDNMNQYTQAGSFSYGYDDDGNLTSKTNGTDTWTYEYNDNNRLVRSTGPEGTSEYVYNGLGFLVKVITDGVEKHYTVDPFGLGNTVGEYDAAGELTSRYTHGLGLIGKDDLFYTFDGNGNTSEMTDASMAIVNYYLYEPFGKSLHALEQVDNEFEFVGQLGVRQMGDDLIYMRNRFYAPSTGRFMAEDPIGLAGGDVSFYRYVANDPVNWVDPWGLRVCNNSGTTIYVKPENSTKAKPVKNGEHFDGAVDGFSVPSKNGGQNIFKVYTPFGSSDSNIDIGPNGFNIEGVIDGMTGYYLEGAPDDGWKDLFDSITPAEPIDNPCP
jgi:RHS repeat-associated protein